MYTKKFKKFYAVCAAVLALILAVGPITASAVDTSAPQYPTENGATNEAHKNMKVDPTAGDYADTDIDVWGFTKDRIVYSVDVEWGAMTFEYETSTWNPETHKQDKTGAGWKIYDESTDTALDVEQNDINKITITNHSNATVDATLNYTTEADFGTSGTFTAGDAANDQIKATWSNENKSLTLDDATTNENGQAVADGTSGTAAKGTVYFMPTNLAEAKITSGVTKWTKIGKITVALTATTPAG